MAARFFLAAVLLLAHSGSIPFSAAQSARLSAAQATLPPAPSAARYRALIEQYRRADADAAVAEIVRWTAGQVRGAALPPETLSGVDGAVLEAVAVLHLEAMVKSPHQVHFSLAHAAFAELTWRQAPPALLRGWYIAMTSVLMSQGGTMVMVTPALGPDAELSLLDGSKLEASGTVMMIVDSYNANLGRNYAARLVEAEGKYREALALAPTLVEARLRLGRVLTLRNRLDDARVELERAQSEASPGYLAYLAALFLGQVHERAGRREAASECYESAIREYPDCQTAYVALGHLRQAAGDLDAGWGAVRQMFRQGDEPRNPQRDPWWVYWYAQYWQINRRMADLRAMVRR
jgi:tetratricopeptide (TPR) repeat protein